MIVHRYPGRLYVYVALISAAVGVAGTIPLMRVSGWSLMAWAIFAPLSAITWLIAVHFLGRGRWTWAIAVGLLSPFLGATVFAIALGLLFVQWAEPLIFGWWFAWHWYWLLAPFGAANGLLVAWLLRRAECSR